MTWRWGKFRPFQFDLIVADPPWNFESWTLDGGNAKGAKGQYETMTLEDIKALPVGEIAAGDTLLLMWCPGWAMATGQAHEVAKAWGFDAITELVWRKLYPSGRPRMGTGYRARTMHEPILLCTTGNPIHKPLRSMFDGVAREHSRKPEEFYEMVERYCPRLQNRLDLFSRQSRPGYETWGNESTKFDLQLTGAAESAHQQKSMATVIELKPLRDAMRRPVIASPGGPPDGDLFCAPTT